jgi:hypothetical protein
MAHGNTRRAGRSRGAAAAAEPRAVSSSPAMRRSYRKVLVTWVVVLAALFAFQEYFS